MRHAILVGIIVGCVGCRQKYTPPVLECPPCEDVWLERAYEIELRRAAQIQQATMNRLLVCLENES